jgi:hypothetical protein
MRIICLGLALSVALNIFQVLTRQEVQLCAKAHTVVVAPLPGLRSGDRGGRGGGRGGARARRRAPHTPKVRMDDGHEQAAMVPERGPMIAGAPHQELLLVLGVMSAEQLPAVGGVGDPKRHAGDPKAKARRARAREYYKRLGVAEILVKFFVDRAWLSNQTQQPEPDDVVGIPSFGKYALEVCGGWGHADLPGTCTTKEARLMSKARGWWLTLTLTLTLTPLTLTRTLTLLTLTLTLTMSKARGWWRVARQWPARYYGQTDDDCGMQPCQLHQPLL